MGDGTNNDKFGELLDFVSILIGYQNLIENREQSKDNDINKSNQEQAKSILNDLHEQFNRQNAMLEAHTLLLKQILKILKGE